MKTTPIISNDLVKEVDDETAQRSLKLHRSQIYPTLAVIVVGQPQGPYIRLKKAHAKSLGIEVAVYELPAHSQTEQISETIEWLNQDEETHGIIIQLPLPEQFSTADLTELLTEIDKIKDVDGLGQGALEPKAAGNLKALEQQAERANKYLPTTAWSMLKLVQEYNLGGEHNLIVGQGKLVGQPLAKLTQALKIKIEQVDKDDDVNKALFKADLVLAGTDAAEPFIDDSFTKEGAALIAAGNELDHKNLEGYAQAMTPAKGGVGPLTISLLMSNLVRACENQVAKRLPK
ncbi:MAG: bifunctional 5,10-methylenetetrahydrofolate dehydrogenase/5,10-methenyltetrahydrofolate cyclohydrolase [bacterium]|nr:bifunctional 5,10-methylenetetrahydrofolate dehydrogenase/5,10-methenyltetrahydrofolate cyclohydrolase [bacterium]